MGGFPEPIDMADDFDPQAPPDGMMAPMGMPALSEAELQLMALKTLARRENAADNIDPDRLSKLGQTVCREFDIDHASRSDWEESARRAMDLARQKRETKNEPWPNASNVKFPMLTTAALQFAARAYPAIVDGPRIVKCQVLGRDDGGVKAAAADRVSQHMSYQLLYEVPDWENDLDTALHQLPIIGCVFKKVYPDGTKPAGFCDDLVSAFDLVVNQSAKSLETVPRVTQVIKLYPHEVGERIRAGRFSDIDIKGTGEDSDDDDSPVEFLEQHRYWDLDDDGVPEPWIVTVHRKSQKVARITAGFDPADIVVAQDRQRIVSIPRQTYFVKIPFIPDPEGGFYDIGFGKLLEPLSDVIDSTINQMMDAGTLQNSGGGFIGSGIDLGKGKSQIRLSPGVYRPVQTPGQDLRAGIVNLEHPGPSKVLFDLLSLMIDSAKDIAAIQDILVGDMPTNQTATATMATIEQGLKVFTAIYKRIFRALRQEYKLIFEINKRGLNVPKYVALLDQPVQVVQADYMGQLDVMPTSDPASITDMQRMAKAQFLMQEVKAGNPVIDPFEATRRALEAARIEDVDKVLIKPGPNPKDELAEEGARAEVDLTKAQTVKTVADAEVALAQIGLPLSAPVQVGKPIFDVSGPAGMPQGMPQGMPMDPMQGGPPPDMGGGMAMEGMPDDMGMDPAMMGAEGLPPELMDQIAAEQMASGDGMPGDGMPPP